MYLFNKKLVIKLIPLVEHYYLIFISIQLLYFIYLLRQDFIIYRKSIKYIFFLLFV